MPDLLNTTIDNALAEWRSRLGEGRQLTIQRRIDYGSDSQKACDREPTHSACCKAQN